MLAIAILASRRHSAPEAAVVTFETLAGPGQARIFRWRLVVGERDGAVLALQLLPAGAADDSERVAATVEQNERLFSSIEGPASLINKRAGEELVLTCLLKLAAHVDEFDFGQGAILDAIVHFDACVFALCRILPAFERRRCRAEHHDGVGKLGAHDGNIASVVARSFFLLVALVVLFVDEDEAEIGHWCEDGGARTDDDGRITAMDATPLLGALFWGERGMEQGDAGTKGCVEKARHLRGEADLRDEKDRCLTSIEGTLHGG